MRARASLLVPPGVTHEFSMILKGKERVKPIVVDVVSEPKGVKEDRVLQFFAKTLDVEHDTVIMVAIPKASKTAKKMAESYGLSLIQAKDSSDAAKAIIDLISRSKKERNFLNRKIYP